VPDSRLLENILPALNVLAAELDYVIVDDADIMGLTANQAAMALPEDLAFILSVDWNSTTLTPNSMYAWERDNTTWRETTAGSPSEYVVQGRMLILNPPPSSTAVTTDPYLRLRYIASSPGMTATGTPGLSALDQELVVLEASVRYCYTHPNERTLARVVGLEKLRDRAMAGARRRAQRAVRGFHPRFGVHVTRDPGAR
jgi:hypothetical protein